MSARAKVAIVKCSTYSAGLQEAIDSLLAELGGTGVFVKPGQSVLIKPNLLASRTPDQAVTTHPEVVRALIRAFRGHGAEPCVGDSPNNVVKIEKVWERTGFSALCREEGVSLVNFEKAGSTRFTVDGVSFTVAQPVLDADVLVNVPKVKTHVLTIFTGAVKNLYGTVPGFQKTSLHKSYPTPRDFGRLLAALYSKVKPQLSIADGVVGLEGNGPSAGDPVELGFLAGSEDSVALDIALCRLLRIDLRAVPYFRELRKARLGETDWNNIEMTGTPIEDVAPAEFRTPSTLLGRLIPGWLMRRLKRYLWIRPEFLDHCVACGLCVKACPVGALSLEGRERPLLAGKKCIECCCCHEACPEKAVRMTQSPLFNAIRRGRLP